MPILFEMGRETQVTRSSDFVKHGAPYVFETAGEGWQQLACAGGGAFQATEQIAIRSRIWSSTFLSTGRAAQERVAEGRADCDIPA